LRAHFRDPDAVAAMGEQIAANWGMPTQFVHLPALRLSYECFTKFVWARFQADMSVQVQSAVILLKRCLPKMAKVPESRVLFILSSVTRATPPKFMSMYTVAKYAPLGLMRALGAEYAATEVRINAISPGMVETQFLEEIAEVALKMSASGHPLGRNAVPEDLLGAMELCCRPGQVTSVEWIFP